VTHTKSLSYESEQQQLIANTNWKRHPVYEDSTIHRRPLRDVATDIADFIDSIPVGDTRIVVYVRILNNILTEGVHPSARYSKLMWDIAKILATENMSWRFIDYTVGGHHTCRSDSYWGVGILLRPAGLYDLTGL